MTNKNAFVRGFSLCHCLFSQYDLWERWATDNKLTSGSAEKQDQPHAALAPSLSKSPEHPELHCGTFLWMSGLHECCHILLLGEELPELSHCEKAHLDISWTLFYASLLLAHQHCSVVKKKKQKQKNYSHKRSGFRCVLFAFLVNY